MSQHKFNQVPKADISRSSFDRSHGLKTTFDAGDLIPMFVDEVIPGDTFNCRMAGFGRLATPIHPFIDNMMLDTQFFFVPNRLLWSNWEKFNGAQDNPDDSTDYLIPTTSAPATVGYPNQSMFDYMGIPTQVPGLEHNVLHMRAYNLIWNEWYRDENLQDSLPVLTGDGPDSSTNYTIQKRGKRKDYFTSALPWPQKGPSVPLPLGGEAAVRGFGKATQVYASSSINVYESKNSGTTTYQNAAGVAGSPIDSVNYLQEDPNNPGFPRLYADLSTATATTINELRQAFQIQKLFERDARGGTRYTEIVKSHFGVTSPDARLQRPEYLGGGSSPINVNPVAQTSETATSPQGNLAAIGTTSFNGHGFNKSFTEHGVIIGLVSVRADLNYQQGLNKMFSRSTRQEFFWPALQNIGEQAILNKEIYAQGDADPAADEAVFGYQERYAEYRYKPSTITGQMRSNDALTLDTWHLAQDFAAIPVLNDEFIVEQPPVDRVIAVTSEPHLLFDAYFKLICARPMPTYSVPGLIDHF